MTAKMKFDRERIGEFLFGLLLLVVAFCLSGCNASNWVVVDNQQTITVPDKKQDTSSFDAATCSEAIARQAELLATSNVLKSSEVVDGILNEGEKCGIPEDYTKRVRAAVDLTKRRVLSAEDITAIRAVK